LHGRRVPGPADSDWLVFAGDAVGRFKALDDATGKTLW
jgi:hypothetical protein